MTTLCALAGLKPPDTADGIDLSPVALGTGNVHREEALLMTLTSHWDFLQTQTAWPEWRGIKTRTHTYVRWLTGEEELYDDRRDPFQMRNRIAVEGEQDRVKHLRRRLWELLAEAGDDFRPGTEYANWYSPQRRLVRDGG
jgi:hypothetical protein